MPDFDEDFPPLGAPPKGGASKEPDEEWQLISTGDEDDQAENDASSTGEEQETKPAAVIIQGNPKMLRHAASSPDLRAFHHILEEENDEEKVDDSSFSMVSNVGSVWSGQSFRDAFLSSPVREGKVDENEPTESTKSAGAPRPYRKPKFVVANPSSIRRCSQSSPNLLGLIHEHDEVMGETDANDYYHRKSKGAQGHVHGLKLRPDEAKRKAFAVNKRNMQRQGK